MYTNYYMDCVSNNKIYKYLSNSASTKAYQSLALLKIKMNTASELYILYKYIYTYIT